MFERLTEQERKLFHAIYRGDVKSVEYLLLNGVNPDVEDLFSGIKPIHFAASRGNIKILEVLLSDGRVKADAVDRRGKVPYEWADEFGQSKAETFLIDTILGDFVKYSPTSRRDVRCHLKLKGEKT